MSAVAFLTSLLLLDAVSQSIAITDEDVYGVFSIPLAVPGARSAAMGGASLALVGDPAASRINPARLAAVMHPELALEGRRSESEDLSSVSGLQRFDPSINPFAGAVLTVEASPDEGAIPSFLAYAHPLRLSEHVVVAVSRLQVMDVSIAASTRGATTPLDAPLTPSAGDEVILQSRGDLDIELELWDLAAGWRLTPGFAVGGAIGLGRLDLSSETTGSLGDPLQFTTVGMFDPRFSSPTPAPLVRTRSRGDDTHGIYSFGTYWRAHRSLSLATVYRKGPRFTIDASREDLSTGEKESFTNLVKMPDTAAVGLSWTPFVLHPSSGLQSLTMALDVERVEYSDLLEGMKPGENLLARPEIVGDVSYDLSDEIEVRLGAEYGMSFPTWTLFLRGGAYTEHQGSAQLESASGVPGVFRGQSDALLESDFFDGEETVIHGTIGFGADFYSVTFDLGADLSDTEDRMFASFKYRFR